MRVELGDNAFGTGSDHGDINTFSIHELFEECSYTFFASCYFLATELGVTWRCCYSTS